VGGGGSTFWKTPNNGLLQYNPSTVLQDKLWDLDKSWENNLVFYGVKEEAGNREETLSMCEGKVREVIKLKLGISRSF
jgi:hypothetical protein